MPQASASAQNFEGALAYALDGFRVPDQGFGQAAREALEAVARNPSDARIDAVFDGRMNLRITAADFFAAKLAYETDPADLAAARANGDGPIVIDVRSRASWEQGHLPGAVHVPNAELAARAAEVLPDRDAEVVVYCWGPGCNGSTRGALTLATLGCTRVRELIGGFEYWAREGLATVGADGRARRAPDPLTAPLA